MNCSVSPSKMSAVALGSNGSAQRHYFKDSLRYFPVPSHHVSSLHTASNDHIANVMSMSNLDAPLGMEGGIGILQCNYVCSSDW